jgi:hypothetical protein
MFKTCAVPTNLCMYVHVMDTAYCYKLFAVITNQIKRRMALFWMW